MFFMVVGKFGPVTTEKALREGLRHLEAEECDLFKKFKMWSLI